MHICGISGCCCIGVLKLYLRELPEPLMTFDLYDEWMRLIDMYVNSAVDI